VPVYRLQPCFFGRDFKETKQAEVLNRLQPCFFGRGFKEKKQAEVLKLEGGAS